MFVAILGRVKQPRVEEIEKRCQEMSYTNYGEIEHQPVRS